MQLVDDGVPYFCHLLGLGLNIGTDAEEDADVGDPPCRNKRIVRIAAAPASACGCGLFVAFADGVLEWYEVAGRAEAFANAGDYTLADAAVPSGGEVPSPKLRRKRTWCLPKNSSGMPSALAVATCAAASVEMGCSGTAIGSSAATAFVGTDEGWLVRVGPGETDVSIFCSFHRPSAVTALLWASEPATPKGSAALLSADAAGRVLRFWLTDASPTSASGPHLAPQAPLVFDLCAEFCSAVLALELNEETGRLLVSTAERIAVVDQVLATQRPCPTASQTEPQQHVRCVGSKPHKGQFTATFSRTFGPEALIASRPGGRLWVAEGSTGRVQTTLKLKRDGPGEDWASLARLVALPHGKALSWARGGGANEDSVHHPASSVCSGDCGTASTVLLLDLEAIAVCQVWSVAPVVDVIRWGGEHVMLAHQNSLSLILFFNSAMAMLSGMIEEASNHFYNDSRFLGACLEYVESLQDALLKECQASELVACVQPFSDAVLGLVEQDAENNFLVVQQIDSFKRWVTRLEERALREFPGPGCDLESSLAMAPLSSFPTAENFGSLGIPTVAIPPDRAREVEFTEAVGPHRSPWACSGTRAAPSTRKHAILTPDLWQRYSRASRSDVSEPEESPQRVEVPCPPWTPAPEPLGSVLRLVAVTPFCGSVEVLQYFQEVLRWLVAVSDQGAQRGIDLQEQSALPACTAFELLCLYAQGSGVSHWPLLGLAPAAGAGLEVPEEPPSPRLPLRSLSQELQAIASAVDVPLRADGPAGSDARCAPEHSLEPWATCTARWTPAHALAFCDAILTCPCVPKSRLERCMFRVNGLAARGGGWPLVFQWLHSRSSGEFLPITITCPTSTWDEVMGRLQDCAHSVEISCGTAELHTVLRNVLGKQLRGTEGGTPMDATIFQRVRRIFELALAHFPKVLPWNIDMWTRTEHHDGSNFQLQQTQGCWAEFFAGEFVQYLLRILPTCKSWADFKGLLETVMHVALHRYRRTDGKIVLHLGSNMIVDKLIERYKTHVWPELFVTLQYPLGILRLLDGLEDVSDEYASNAVKMVLQTLADSHDSPSLDSITEATLPRVGNSFFGGADAGSGYARANECLVAGECVAEQLVAPAGAACRDGPEAAWSCGEDCRDWSRKKPTCGRVLERNAGGASILVPGDLELARTLERRCNAAAWARLLDDTVTVLTNKAALRAEQHPQDAPGMHRIAALERLLVALAMVRAGPEALAAVVRATQAGALSDVVVSGAVATLWAEAVRRPGGMSSTAGSKVQFDRWLCLPPPQPPPALPPMKPRRRLQILSEPTRVAGFCQERQGDLVEFSEGGLVARHRDDTGDLMHGVVFSAASVGLGRAGLYFELELLETRPEECLDGLTIGVTATHPAAVPLDPPTVEHVPHTWAVGYDGQMWDAQMGVLSAVDWDPRCLVERDIIGVLVTLSEGELLVFHNGMACCPGPRGIPVSSEPLFAVVDLLGAARAVRWVVGAVAPIGDEGS